MDGLVVLIAITLTNISLCCMVYLGQTVLKTVFKLIEIKEFLEKDQ